MTNKTKKQKKVTTLKTDAVDHLMFEVVREAPKFDDLVTSDLQNNSEGLVQDVFTSFFAYEPQTVEKAEPVQKGIIDTMMSLPEYQNLRASAKYDEVASALGSMQFAPEVMKQYVEIKKKIEERKKQQGSGLEGNGEGEQDGEGQSLEEMLDAKEMASLRQSIRRGLEKAQEASDEYKDMCSAWGIEKGDLTKVPFEKRMELAERMKKSNRLKKIADLTGRFRNIVHTAAANTPVHGADEVVDIGLSNDISHMLPTELVKLMETPDLFVADYLERKLLTYNLKGVQDMGKGPIIALLDNSGSMDGERIEWAVAVAMSLMVLAEKQNRAFGLIVFNTQVCYKKLWQKGSRISAADKVSVAEIGCSGGTSFYAPVKAAFEFRKQDPQLKPADFVFITDGDCDDIKGDMLTEVIEEKNKADVRIYSIVINAGGWGGNSTGGTLKNFSDHMVVVNKLGEIDTIKNLMTQTASTQKPKKAKV